MVSFKALFCNVCTFSKTPTESSTEFVDHNHAYVYLTLRSLKGHPVSASTGELLTSVTQKKRASTPLWSYHVQTSNKYSAFQICFPPIWIKILNRKMSILPLISGLQIYPLMHPSFDSNRSILHATIGFQHLVPLLQQIFVVLFSRHVRDCKPF